MSSEQIKEQKESSSRGSRWRRWTKQILLIVLGLGWNTRAFCPGLVSGSTGGSHPPVERAVLIPTGFYFRALSVIIDVQAPSGSLVMTGSEPAESSVCTVRL